MCVKNGNEEIRNDIKTHQTSYFDSFERNKCLFIVLGGSGLKACMR